tara:strand:+ start:108 stop:329 length:222 start_codon:yes stop_codon:yes gene_type:complete
MTIYKVSGYYLDNKEIISDCLITDSDDCIKDLYGEEVDLPMGLTDEDIFYYGMNVPKEMGNHEFKITEWEVLV